MKTISLPFRGVVVGILSTALYAQDPVLTTPGTATWLTETTDTGTRTVFTITDNTIFDWGSMNLAVGNELIFDFAGGESVANYLGGTGVNVIAGTVTSNGIVGFFSPNAKLVVTGDITAKGVTLSTHDVVRGSFGSGGSIQMSGSAARSIDIFGNIRAIGGDVVIASSAVTINRSASLSATGDVLLAGGSEVLVSSGGGNRLSVGGDAGFVLHLGESSASRIEVAAVSQIKNQGILSAPSSRIFLEVGAGGDIVNAGSGLIVADPIFEGTINRGTDVEAHEGDSASPVSDAVLRIPTLKRPDGSRVSGSKTVKNSTSMSASGDATRDARRRDQRVVKRRKSPSLVRRSSFFGMRGGKTVTTKKR